MSEGKTSMRLVSGGVVFDERAVSFASVRCSCLIVGIGIVEEIGVY